MKRIRKFYAVTEQKEIICSKCNINKTKEFYHRDKLSSTGLAKKCKECRKEDTLKDYKKHSEDRKKVASKYYYGNKVEVLKSRLKRQKVREKTDLQYRLKRRLRNRLYYALKNKNWKKNTKFSQYIGCTQLELVTHLEKQFIQNMSWNNYGNWHIDHKIPLDSASTEEELYKLCHYTNLQPMWAVDNIRKGNNV